MNNILLQLIDSLKLKKKKRKDEEGQIVGCVSPRIKRRKEKGISNFKERTNGGGKKNYNNLVLIWYPVLKSVFNFFH